MQHEFEVAYDSSYDELLVIPSSTKMPRHITKTDFRKVWEKFVKVEGNPYRPGHYQRETRNASYILALVKDILEEKTKEQSLEFNQEALDVLELKSMKGSLAGLTRFTWDELEEMTEKFIKEGRRWFFPLKY